MNVLVTGGAGFIGSHLVDALCARGDEVTILDNFDDAYDPAIKERNVSGFGARLVRGDIRDPILVAQLVRETQVVVHLAARAGVRESLDNPLVYEEVNLRGTLVVLDAMRRIGGGRLVFASSSSVYGSKRSGPFFEDDPADQPVSPYAATKRAGELLCHAAHAAWGLPVTCLRFFTVYGPRQRPAMAIARFVRLALEGKPLPVFGDGSARRDYTWVHDAVGGVLAAVDRPRPFAVINLGGAAPVRLDTLVAAIAGAAGREVTVDRLPDQPGDVPLTFADIGRAGELLDWRPHTTLEQGIVRYVEWVRSGAR